MPTASTTSTTIPPPLNVTSLGTIVAGINCDTVDYVQRYSPIVLTQIFQFILAYTSASLIIGSRAIQQHTYFHPNVKVLLKTYHVAVFFHGLAQGTAQIYHILTSMSYESCELLISCKLCFGFRLLITASLIAFALLLFAIPLERTVATLNLGKGYENRKASLGQVLSFLVVGSSLAYSTWYHWVDMSSRTCTHCVYDKRVMIPPELMNALCILCMISLFYTVILLIINRWKLRRKTYSLAIEFQINQNLRVLMLVLPISLLTLLAFLWYSSSPYIFDVSDAMDPEIQHFHKMLQNIFPIYTFLGSSLWLTMMCMERKKKRVGMMPPEMRKDEKDVYFQSLQDQWSRVPSHKPSGLQILSVFSVSRRSITS